MDPRHHLPIVPPLLFVSLAMWLATSGARALELRQDDQAIEVWASKDKLILRYHKTETPLPQGVSEVYRRSGYIHPVMTPDGRELTGDFPVDHLHQHALFMAWTSGNYAGKPIDFWNQAKAEGRVAHRRVLATSEKGGQVSFSVELSLRITGGFGELVA